MFEDVLSAQWFLLFLQTYQRIVGHNSKAAGVVNEGFEVDYSDASGGCLACQDSGGICEFDEEFRCRCGDTTLPFTCRDNGKPPAYLMQPNTKFARKIHSLKLTTMSRNFSYNKEHHRMRKVLPTREI
ncbi:hypothetical protein RND71_026571 [Anisodus tanguticus]|uniref:Wall-associated receptor kinase C-terminal domain-containing protein n=1 Tax=Anisodus tanguticus TaxID=243964 RepID=A0AAE1RP51_9SOLA|nr:hypothetical protein RND71_026571 [Anisodus tanguticus]